MGRLGTVSTVDFGNRRRQAKSMIKGVDLSVSAYALRLSRKDLRILIGLLTGHADLNRHMTLIRVRSDPMCPLCQEEEETTLRHSGDVKHFHLLDLPI